MHDGILERLNTASASQDWIIRHPNFKSLASSLPYVWPLPFTLIKTCLQLAVQQWRGSLKFEQWWTSIENIELQVKNLLNKYVITTGQGLQGDSLQSIMKELHFWAKNRMGNFNSKISHLHDKLQEAVDANNVWMEGKMPRSFSSFKPTRTILVNSVLCPFAKGWWSEYKVFSSESRLSSPQESYSWFIKQV